MAAASAAKLANTGHAGQGFPGTETKQDTMSSLQDKWDKARRVGRAKRQARILLTDAHAAGRTGPNCLIVNTAQMGDVVLSVGVIAALRARMPQAALLFAGVPQWLPVVDGDPNMDGVLAVQSLYEVRALAKSGLFETVYVLDIPIPTLLNYLDGIPTVFRYAPPTTGDWYTHNRNLMSFYEANAGLAEGEARPRVWIGPKDEACADALLRQHNLGNTLAPLIALHTHSSMAAKNWPGACFAELAARWHDKHGARFVVVGGPGEGQATAYVPGVVNLAGQVSVKETAAVIARCDLFVGPDSGLAYVAEAVGTPGLVILGATVPQTSGPRDASFSFVRAPGACLPACHRACVRVPLCIMALTVDAADAALSDAWRRQGKKGA